MKTTAATHSAMQLLRRGRDQLRRHIRPIGRVAFLLDFARPAPVMTAGLGQGLRFQPGDSNRDYGTGDNEQPVQDALRACLNRGDVFYDVGANVGFFSVICARLVGPSGLVLAFEPVPANAELVHSNADLNGFRQVRVVREAVSSACGRGELALAEYSGGSMLRSVGVPPDYRGKNIEVEMTTIDEVVFGRGTRPPNVVKIDVEGAEIDVLRGTQRTLVEHRPTIIFEVDDEHESSLEVKYAECRAFLDEHGYRVTRLPSSYPEQAWHVAHALGTPA